MPSNLKTITLYGQILGPNPFKVAILLAVLGLPYTISNVPFDQVKGEAYVKLNPNGRLPTIEDPNTGITIWESGAIIEYLIATYDQDHLISFPAGSKEDWECKQWLHFQTSGQGPYYGQAWWFKNYEKIPTPHAIDRYANEIKRVTCVLDGWLKERKFLVGEKCTYADLAFIPWQVGVVDADMVPNLNEDLPAAARWMKRLTEREEVKKIIVERNALKASLAAHSSK